MMIRKVINPLLPRVPLHVVSPCHLLLALLVPADLSRYFAEKRGMPASFPKFTVVKIALFLVSSEITGDPMIMSGNNLHILKHYLLVLTMCIMRSLLHLLEQSNRPSTSKFSLKQELIKLF